uniref:Transcriptional factor DELLA N-terminal domain-containing protein n=1 Tax=Lactuca sativa TaxID=4236 RepID=A0A9R1WZP9_LACSA|nr:hypothetical protein LSAT_V11C800444480 [Lactuca sativa]
MAVGIGKAKHLHRSLSDSSGMDEFLEVLGYKVRLMDMADVAKKLEQLEMMCIRFGKEIKGGVQHKETRMDVNGEKVGEEDE